MRSDMRRVIIERERSNSCDRAGDLKGPARRRFKRQGKISRCSGTKGQRDLLGPLRKFLLKNCGRPWDKVWSEICTSADLRTIDGKHLRDHIDRWVNTSQHREVYQNWKDFYVDAHGILREDKDEGNRYGYVKLTAMNPPPPDKQDLPNRYLKIGKARYAQIRGIWYELQYRPVESKRVYRSLSAMNKDIKVLTTIWLTDASDIYKSLVVLNEQHVWGHPRPYEDNCDYVSSYVLGYISAAVGTAVITGKKQVNHKKILEINEYLRKNTKK